MTARVPLAGPRPGPLARRAALAARLPAAGARGRMGVDPSARPLPGRVRGPRQAGAPDARGGDRRVPGRRVRPHRQRLRHCARPRLLPGRGRH